MRSIYDALILGSGFAGSLLGWILAKEGWNVLLVDPGRHPRFAIGESSTPTADFLIAHLAQRWNLPALAPLACWGSWKTHYPDLICGKKRGFSYYRHHPGQPFADDGVHSQSLLVAASCEERWSDTHWLRSSVDQFLARQACGQGATLCEAAVVSDARFDAADHQWTAAIRSGEGTSTVRSRWLIDASGGGAASAKFVDNRSDDAWMRTHTRATFAHYDRVKPFAPAAGPHDSFEGDDAAQHHVFDDGWCWMLRMDNGITSVGVVEKLPGTIESRRRPIPGAAVEPMCPLQDKLARYPSVAELMADARQVAPESGPLTTGRLSRCRRRAQGDGWILLPSAYSFVDPLHSTGIAHSLSGVARIAGALLGDAAQAKCLLHRYGQQLRQETRWLDTLVAGCYQGLPSFSRFVAFASLYFVAAIRFEAAMESDPMQWPDGFLQAGDSAMRAVAEELIRQVSDPSSADEDFVQSVRERISPWNTVGLLEPASRNRLHHTAAPKYGVLGTTVSLS